MSIEIHGINDMSDFGVRLGSLLVGGVIIELVGDVGAGKTTLAKGIALGLGVDDTVQSPSFTISHVYSARDDLRLAHYDFYRLTDPGVMQDELREAVLDQKTVTLIEWAEIVRGVLPEDRLTIHITPRSETDRSMEITANGKMSQWIKDQL